MYCFVVLFLVPTTATLSLVAICSTYMKIKFVISFVCAQDGFAMQSVFLVVWSRRTSATPDHLNRSWAPWSKTFLADNR